MSYGYGGQQNPFDQRENEIGGNGGGYGGPNMGRDEYGANNVEMALLADQGHSFGSPKNVLNEVSEINRGIDMIDQNLDQLRMLQQRALDDADASATSNTNRQLDALSSETMAHYRALTDRVRQLKSNPESQQKYTQQVRRVDTRLKDAIRAYQGVESAFRKKTQEQMARQYRIVRPDADEEEVRAAVEDQTGGQVFQQALMQSNRRGQAQSVLSAVQDRHAQLKKIEQQMIELAQLFQDMDTLIIQQEVPIANIEQKAEEVVENLDKGNMEVGTAVNTARATRKKKWICLGIVVLIIAIIVIVVAVYVSINNAAKPAAPAAKRSLLQPNARSWFENVAVPQILAARSHPRDLTLGFSITS
ncbi:t-SNARE [Hypoxylon fragiforme]|uniref:t-SNARE n=1 Tax=Hypoxylon fragiforme TaxID=63214 RepID=UPI0020C63B22|nr:t-SNARE [Hypoxylon fragiforme]KAI2603784.1 t-SNARE [Hypoxylon fragiforme]